MICPRRHTVAVSSVLGLRADDSHDTLVLIACLPGGNKITHINTGRTRGLFLRHYIASLCEHVEFIA
jgi:hypothetical protein